jgi:hypothetical protein
VLVRSWPVYWNVRTCVYVPFEVGRGMETSAARFFCTAVYSYCVSIAGGCTSAFPSPEIRLRLLPRRSEGRCRWNSVRSRD